MTQLGTGIFTAFLAIVQGIAGVSITMLLGALLTF